MNSLDSRLIFPGDSFVQVFSQAGSYRYGFGLPTLGRPNAADSPFAINVKEPRDKERQEGKQHTVLVRLECGRLIAEPSVVELEAGDAVLWSPGGPATPGFCVSGFSETHSFSSVALNSEAMYVHAFGSTGVFKWRDANGRGPSGTVEVLPQTRSRGDAQSYQDPIRSAVTAVVISGSNVEPAHLKIGVNQAVVFVVEKAEGIGTTITDERLVV